VIEAALRASLAEQFEFEDERRGCIARRKGLRAQLDAAGFTLDSNGVAAPSELGGRNALWSFRVGHEEFVLRRFTHGGLLRWLTGRRFRDPERPFREAQLSQQLQAAGIATPDVVCMRAVRAGSGGWNLDLVTRRVVGARDLSAVLESTDDRAVRARLLDAFGGWLRRLHDVGFLHADLHPKNVLVRGGAEPPFELWVVDLDRSVFRAELGDRERAGNLARLLRYVWRRRTRLGLRAHDLARTLRAYEPDGVRRQELWRRIRTRTERTLLLHRAGWWLERRR